jgi:hypothetical protein
MSEAIKQAKVQIEETYSCSTGWDDSDIGWLWTHGRIDSTKFKGACLSASPYLDVLEDLTDDERRRAILKGRVTHGWVITTVGDLSGCGGDYSLYFETTKPEVYIETYTAPDGFETEVTRWGAHQIEEENEAWKEGDDSADLTIEKDVEVADGPNEATWLAPRYPSKVA